MTAKDILVFDHLDTGHHPTFIAAYVKALLELGHRVYACYSQPEIFVPFVQTYGDQLTVIPIRRTSQKKIPRNRYLATIQTAVQAFGLWIRIGTLTRRVERETGRKPDMCLIMMIDAFMSPFVGRAFADRMLRTDWVGLLMRPRYGEAHMRFGMRNVLHARHCREVLIIDEDRDVIAQTARMSGKPVHVMPEVTDEAIDGESGTSLQPDIGSIIHARAAGRTVVSLLGNLGRMKGLDAFMDLASSMPADKFLFVAAGPMSESEENPTMRRFREFAKHPPEHCLVMLERISDGPPFNALVQSSDIIFALYLNFPHSSNLMTKAALFRKPVLVPDGQSHIMAEAARRYGLGIAVPERDIVQARKALEGLACGTGLSGAPLQPRYDEYLALHSQMRLKEELGRIFG